MHDHTLIIYRSFAAMLGVVIYLVVEANLVLGWRGQTITDYGFGEVRPETFLDAPGFPTTVIGIALVANSPQVILSVLYFSYNGLFTTMLLGHEWISYAHKRKGLRVSRKPKGFQRSTYFLQLPYRYSVPLNLLGVALHWMISQSIFLVAVDFYDALGEQPGHLMERFEQETSSSARRCGYSPIAMISVIAVGAVMIATIIGFGFLPYKRGMPLAGSCSMAISAACHPRKDDGSGSDAPCWEQKLRWGVYETTEDGVGHCAFSSEVVEPLHKGQFYR